MIAFPMNLLYDFLNTVLLSFQYKDFLIESFILFFTEINISFEFSVKLTEKSSKLLIRVQRMLLQIIIHDLNFGHKPKLYILIEFVFVLFFDLIFVFGFPRY